MSPEAAVGIGIPRFDIKLRTALLVPSLGECWLWQGSTTEGYGQGFYKGRVRRVHLITWDVFRGEVPDGLTLDHLCHTEDKDCYGGESCLHRSCCNPTHLEAITRAENTRRGRGNRLAEKTHCVAGHPYDSEHLYVDPRGKRECRTCHRNHRRRRSALARAS